MIIEFKIKNFLSFRDEVKFSFEATSDKALEKYYVAEPIPGIRLLKMAMVYGPNASGKSNLLKAFKFIKKFIHNIPKIQNNNTGFIPFMFDSSKKKPGEFELTFIADKQKHRYILKIDQDKVISEKLFNYPTTQPAVIFDRYFDDEKQISIIEFGAKIKISDQAKEAIQLRTLKNMSVFAAVPQFNIAIPEINRSYNWFRNEYMSLIDTFTELTEYSDRHIKSSEGVKKFALEFLRKADFNISNIIFKEEVINVTDDLLKMFDNMPISEKEKERIKKEKTLLHVQKLFEHEIEKNGKKEYHTLDHKSESQGTLRYYGLSAPFYNLISKNAFLPIDEISSSLHPKLVSHLIKEYLLRSEQAQLLFTTHHDSILLQKDILRKDAIWFTDKGKDGVSTLYSLDEFPIRKELSYYNAYRQGKFGAVPDLED